MKFIVLTFLMFTLQPFAYSQLEPERPRQTFKKISKPEKWWAMTHPFIAKKAHNISMRCLALTDSLHSLGALDKDPDGGQLDAFRHIMWMSLSSRQFGKRRARSLGNAHEKGNYLDFMKAKFEENSIPDKKASEMDFANNELGIRLGRENKRSSESRIMELVIWTIEDGQAMKIRKNKYGTSLSCDGAPIREDDWMGKWENDRCLVPSNHVED